MTTSIKLSKIIRIIYGKQNLKKNFRENHVFVLLYLCHLYSERQTDGQNIYRIDALFIDKENLHRKKWTSIIISDGEYRFSSRLIKKIDS